MMSGSPGRGGYFPIRCSRSARFTPAARTRTRRSPSRSAGSATSEASSSFPFFTTMARMVRCISRAMAVRVFDDRQRELLFIRPPRRIVSLVPSDTLNVQTLGGTLVGRTRYCEADAPVVGGTKDVDVEAVAKLEPDLILANQEENSRVHLEEL